ncbi:MAG: S8 family serine peptidase [Symbiobacteriaceae bacterium]
MSDSIRRLDACQSVHPRGAVRPCLRLAAAVLAACLVALPVLVGLPPAGAVGGYQGPVGRAEAAGPAGERVSARPVQAVAARPGELIVKPRAARSRKAVLQAVEREPRLRIQRTLPTGAAVVRVDDPARTAEVAEALRRSGRYEYVQPNYVYRLAVQPGDPLFGQQWGLHNEGQAVLGRRGRPGVDIGAPAAWDVTRGSAGVVVAVIDTGVDLRHPDLAGAAWVNEAEAKGRAGVDDDGNGYVDDVHGYDFYHRDSTVFDPEDGDEHGTHVAGIIAARWDNGEGVAGVAPGARIMVLKVFAGDTGTSADAVEAIAYAERMGARIVNMSWGGFHHDQALKDAIARSHMLFVAAAGNNGQDNDARPYYPASYDLDNLVAVAAVNSQGYLPAFSNFGRKSVDLAAPGEVILSTVPGAAGQGAYAYMSGTSMAAPHVTGVAALVASRFPWLSAAGIRQHLLATARRLPALEGAVAVPGLPDAGRAVQEEPVAPVEPERSAFIDVSPSMTLYGEIQRAADLGLVEGYGDGRFAPDEDVQRHQLAKMIVNAYERALGVSLPIDPSVDFPDVDEGRNLGPFVAKAATAGWILGYDDGTFRPTRPITRLETALIIARALDLPPAASQPFADVPPAYTGEVGAVAEAGIMKGMAAPAGSGARLFRPGDHLSRAQAAGVAVRVYDALTHGTP